MRNARRPGDRRRLDRLDAGDREAARDDREAAARRGGAARPRHRSRRRLLGADRRGPDGEPWCSARVRPSAIRHAGAAAPHRHRARRGRVARPPSGTAASACRPKRCGRPPPPNLGASAIGCRGRVDGGARDIARVIEAANAEEEALAIAVALREAVETPDKTAALVTPDRALARRVLAALARWNVAVDDSGGDALADTPAGVFARLAAEAALGGLAPVTLLALLKHPLFRLGAAAGTHARAIAALERAVLRGPRPRAGTAGLAQALATFRADARSDAASVRSAQRTCAIPSSTPQTLVERLGAALAPLEKPAVALPFVGIAALHAGVLRALSADDAGNGNRRSRATTAQRSRLAFEEIAAQRRSRPARRARRLSRAVRRRDRGPRGAPRRPAGRARAHLRPLEARLQNVDRVVLGGLVEGAWPPETRSDPWLQPADAPRARPRSAGAAHRPVGARFRADCSARAEVILTRAAKLGGAPTVASRFVQRLAAVAGDEHWNAARAARREVSRLGARARSRRPRSSRVATPAPKPPLAARPTRLSGHRDRALAARSLHDLRQAHPEAAPLDPVDTPPGARDRGTVIHGAIGDFTEDIRGGTAGRSARRTASRSAQKHFARSRIIRRRAPSGGRASSASRAGSSAGKRSGAPTSTRAACRDRAARSRSRSASATFTLTARADRIERCADGTLRDPRLQDRHSRRPRSRSQPGSRRS